MPSKKAKIGIGLATAAVVLIIVITLAVVLTQKPLCNTDVCKRTAENLKKSMDESVDPCEDFYSFACGKYVDANSGVQPATGHFYEAIWKLNRDLQGLLDSAPLSGRRGSAVDNAIRLYRGCKHSAKNEQNQNKEVLKSILRDNLGGCPLLPATTPTVSPTPNVSWSQSVANTIRNLDQDFFFSVLILPDPTGATYPDIVLYPEMSGLMNDPKTVMRAPPAPQPVRGYASENDQIKKIICEIDNTCYSNQVLDRDIQQMLYNYPPNLINAEDAANTTQETMPIRELQKRIPDVQWLEFFTTVFSGTSTTVTNETKVTTIVGYIDLIIKTYFRYKDDRVRKSFIGWRIIGKWGAMLIKTVGSLVSGDTVEGRCLQFTNNVMGYAVGNLYNSKFVSGETYNETMRLVVELKNAFKELLKENTWMDEATKDKALQKIDNMVQSVSAPDWARNDATLDAYYGKIKTISQDNFPDALKAVSGFGMVKNADLLKQKVNRTDFWSVKTSAQTNAFNYQNGNAMMFPSGILAVPFFEHGRPSAMNYGAFGYIAGHEITHGFDNAGRLRDEWGRVKNWWSESSLRKFNESAACFVSQYSRIYEPKSGKYLNGVNTLGENIADNGGIREAFRAFKNYQNSSGEKDERLPGLRKYTQEQLFFISAGYMYCTAASWSFLGDQIKNDVHSPNQYRVTVPFQNSKDFSDAFDCGKKDKMNPQNKCVIW